MELLIPLATLTTDIKKFVRQLSNLEHRLRNSRCLYTAQDILVGGEVRMQRHAVDGVEVVHRRVIELELARATYGFLHSGVLP